MTADIEQGLTIVVPALNEEGGISAVLSAINDMREHLGIPSEVIVVNDGSTDRTAELAESFGARVIAHPMQAGYGRSLKTGIRAARYALVAISDADGTYPVEEIPAMVERMIDVDAVIGTRTGANYMKHIMTSPLRSTFLLLTNIVTGTWISDPNSGLRVFRRSDLLPILDRLPNAFSFTTTHTLIATLEHQFVVFKPIAYHERIGRSKVRPVRDALRVGQTLVEVMLRYNPLKLFALLAVILGVVSLPLLLFGDGLAEMMGLFALSTAVIVMALGMVTVAIAGGAPSAGRAPIALREETAGQEESGKLADGEAGGTLSDPYNDRVDHGAESTGRQSSSL